MLCISASPLMVKLEIDPWTSILPFICFVGRDIMVVDQCFISLLRRRCSNPVGLQEAVLESMSLS